ncbi:protein takeout-like [Galleria mellonella]|uniref:Protein takeout-like n=1 Tax=Galleria mellonella TaxID=7137 RepID=A0ABM3MW80_GALME|nr:protein takeout-like [Galleria mellonella]
MKTLFFLFTCFSVYICAYGGNTAPFITPCRQSDSSCLKTTAQKAVPVLAAGYADLQMISMDPMHISRIKSNQAGLQMDFKNSVVKGLRKCIVLDLTRKDNKIKIKTKCSAVLIGDYKLNGKLLIMPIEGSGKYKIKITDIIVDFSFEMGERRSAGDVYWVFQNWRYNQQVDGNVRFHFQNLFNGNKELSDSIHEFANSNWKDIFNELSQPIMDAVMKKIVAEIRKLFDKVPLKELVLD